MGLGALLNSVILKFWINPRCIKQLMLPLMILGWGTGRGIIETPLGNRWPLTSCIYSLMLVFGFCAAVKVTLENVDKVLVTTSTVEALMINLNLYANICVIICNTLVGWMGMRGTKIIIDALQVAGEKIQELGIPQKCAHLFWRRLIILTCEIIFVVYITVIWYVFVPSNNDVWWHKIVTTVSLHYPITAISIGDAVFVSLVRALNQRFAQLNRVLKEMLPSTDDLPQHKRVLEHTISKRRNDIVCNSLEKLTNDDPNVIRMTLENHYELTRIGCCINQTFGTQALLSMSYSFYVLIGLLYRTSALLLWSSANKSLIQGEVVSLLSWVVLTSYKIINMSSVCASTSNACKETGIIICQLHEPSTSKAFRDEISDFSLQMTQHTLEFSACGLFPVDHSLMQSMVASIATYLIILVQIGDPKVKIASTSTEPPTPLQ